MKVDTFYRCPVCHSSWDTEKEAIACRNKHPILIKQWYTCEICGAGWCPVGWGEKTAAKLAGECEQKHRDKGEIKEVGIRTFFFSGGRCGKYFPPEKGVNEGGRF